MTDHEHQWYQSHVNYYGDPYIAEKCKYCSAWRCGYVPIAANRDIQLDPTKRAYIVKKGSR